ncbi:hypothetical protein ASPVEDRAFT_89781 [Aspergillus versicolor CBS 583.65]|uniref:Major facilitator superfamily (MFS) profile domain-containing protein n=1 Tax=Aspergillus versicolor CBS 583.65 TaxID=1036611 RepID=A0A1L9Q478_ASPVE|nr:uncharacterized protein ASPVEDRAFT_89781 [Aspergillus versicolor CBS 583.65]OJJ08570.1 hypothetical protein ASPVEDRAFT_89781 [Aspergillus versicolor CBS 583.65]
MAVTSEESPLLRPRSDTDTKDTAAPPTPKRSDLILIFGTFIGVFIASADEALVISTYSAIASQFHHLSQGSWLLLAYNFGYCISLPVYSVLGDAYGRKNVLICSYTTFAVSCLACGASATMTQLILSRVLAGSSGAGMIIVVSVILSDIIAPHEIALYRSYQNIVNVAGRSLGGPIGGFLTDTIGWRWAFYGQIPIILLCTVFVGIRLPSFLNDTLIDEAEDRADQTEHRRSPVWDLDFSGIFTFSGTILALLFFLQELGTLNEDTVLRTALLGLGFVAGCILFVTLELFWAEKPLIPIRIYSSGISAHFLLQVLLLGGRYAFLSNLVPYFIRVTNTSNLLASLSLVVVAIGVAIGGVVCGLVIKYTKRCKSMTLASIFNLTICTLLIFIQWRNGFKLWYGIYLIPFGIATGMLFPALFVGMSTYAPEGKLHVCIGTYYLCQQLGLVIGPAAGSALNQKLFAARLGMTLEGLEDKSSIIHRILNEVRFANTLPSALREVVRSSYLDSFQYLPLLATVVSAAMFPIAAILRESEM